jgi:hypothetical protein
MISQDRHEIFLTIAEYNAAYISYATEIDIRTDESFSHMTQYGPFVVTGRLQMSKLVQNILAFTIQACQ